MDNYDIEEALRDELLGEFLLMDDNEYTIELLKRINEVLPEYINRIEFIIIIYDINCFF